MDFGCIGTKLVGAKSNLTSSDFEAQTGEIAHLPERSADRWKIWVVTGANCNHRRPGAALRCGVYYNWGDDRHAGGPFIFVGRLENTPARARWIQISRSAASQRRAIPLIAPAG